ncbi:indole-3-glycerol phosphate synthase [Hydrogenispora ethanolica]|uniref:Indole-3-glycerol phosphate synthase n=1 Tax=Hydrogenispora ethanolica TaxID=1082276 RepID=A0A4R1QPU7_HYDET|nr:indole-3-glycerol phosphate synthase TrpC [Hydrogenispora ethanolica]TCL55846.1 indole-3-glycerol phosphate synthase [Hydrogenispora ethanolica]
MYLERIVNHKRKEVLARQEEVPLSELIALISDLPETDAARDFKSALKRQEMALIAELKKASPSKGLLRADFDPGQLAAAYEQAGAAALSVLTDETFFQGSLQNLRIAKKETRHVPLLRKDFVVDPYQLYEAKLYGADAVLLIVAVLGEEALSRFITAAQDLGLTPLVEVHGLREVEAALQAGAEVIGINNRDLSTFQVNLETTLELVRKIPADVITVSESGIRTRDDLSRLEEAGVAAVLVGETLVTAADPGLKLRQLLGVA